ncbi:MAG: hypothetical protein J7K30_15410 [Deltaproteobacteria bacterium]|nr:hypothetical protein [Deltaproteobacteria bacterium]
MKVIKNDVQKQNLSKFLYDIAKIIFGTVVIFQIIKPHEFKVWIFISGLRELPKNNLPILLALLPVFYVAITGT